MATVPKSTEDVKNTFRGLVPAAEGVAIQPMFGNRAAFVNGNMFAGLFGDKLFVRVADPERDRLIAAGGADFAPMAGRPMKATSRCPRAGDRRRRMRGGGSSSGSTSRVNAVICCP